MDSKIHTYQSDGATVTWDKARCIHYAACVHGLPDVFDADRRPWIDPERASPEALAGVVPQCPTGALHLRLADGTDPEPVPERNRCVVAADGPLYLSGQVTIRTADGDVLLADTRVALCRCGLSKNKPLCDNSHLDAFADAGALPDASGDVAEAGGPITVTVRPNGSLLVEGPLTFVGADGATQAKEKAGLCRCGASENKPYCDGSHKRVGFVAA